MSFTKMHSAWCRAQLQAHFRKEKHMRGENNEKEIATALYQIADLAGYICEHDGKGERNMTFALLIEEKAKWCIEQIEP